jgi:hypothetical protein
VDERFRPALVALEAGSGTAASRDLVLDALDAKSAKVTGETRLRLAPIAIGSEVTEEDALAALAVLAPRHGSQPATLETDVVRSPWTLVASRIPSQLVLPRPSLSAATATSLESVLDTVPAKRTACVGDECPVEAALEMPRRVLREGTRALWLDVAAYYARSGQKAKALDAVERATALTPARRRHQSAPILLAVGDAEGALALLEPDVQDIRRYKPSVQIPLLINHALALAHLGKFERAYESAELSYTTAREAKQGVSAVSDAGYGSGLVDEDRLAAAWLWAALAIKTGRAGDIQRLFADDPDPKSRAVATWLELATKPEPERRALRWNATLREPSGAVLPAVVYAVSQAVPSDSDVDVWLDRIFHRAHRAEPLRTMLARAEAARWRGDAGSERMWLERAARMRGLYDDYASTLLAHIAEIR